MKQLLYLLLILLIPFTLYAQDKGPFAPNTYPNGYTAQLNVVYSKVFNYECKMDLYLAPKTGTPSPVVINIHGGGWTSGVKESQNGYGLFYKLGYSVANIEYRMLPVAPAPAAIEDARCALIYLISNAKELNIDVNKIVIIGSSAGAHLALMAGLLGSSTIFDDDCPHQHTVKVAAIIDQYGPTDLLDMSKMFNGYNAVVNWIGPHKGDENFLKFISPINYVTKDSPPVLILHGTADPLVPYHDSADLYAKLQTVGVKTKFITVQGGGHGDFPQAKNLEFNGIVESFLRELGLLDTTHSY